MTEKATTSVVNASAMSLGMVQSSLSVFEISVRSSCASAVLSARLARVRLLAEGGLVVNPDPLPPATDRACSCGCLRRCSGRARGVSARVEQRPSCHLRQVTPIPRVVC